MRQDAPQINKELAKNLKRQIALLKAGSINEQMKAGQGLWDIVSIYSASGFGEMPVSEAVRKEVASGLLRYAEILVERQLHGQDVNEDPNSVLQGVYETVGRKNYGRNQLRRIYSAADKLSENGHNLARFSDDEPVAPQPHLTDLLTSLTVDGQAPFNGRNVTTFFNKSSAQKVVIVARPSNTKPFVVTDDKCLSSEEIAYLATLIAHQTKRTLG